jgi:UDPglucose--hexose-1-phosphate uridylyltransferase
MPLKIDPPPAAFPLIQPTPDGRWIVTSPGRLHRPKQTESTSKRCPFCEGHEADTPPEAWSDRIEGPADSRGWKVRVVPNLFPILQDANTPGEKHAPVLPGFGRHEVIIERPDHQPDWRGLSDDHLTSIFIAYRERLVAFERDRRIQSSILFKNCGQLAGASQFHAHAQLIGLPAVPPYLQTIFSLPTPTEEILRSRSELLIHADESLVAYAPPASLFPLEVWIGPRQRENQFTNADDALLGRLAQIVARLLSSLSRMIDPLAFHFFIHSPPRRRRRGKMERWLLKITPRLESLGGLEWASNIFINPLPAVWSAEQYRRIATR